MANFFTGSQDKIKQYDPYSTEQRGYMDESLQGAQGQLGNIFKWLNSILNDDPSAYEDFEAPFMQQFQQQTIPQIMERFAGMGAQSSSALNQTLGEAGKNLQMGLASQRAGLKNNAMQQLSGMAEQSMKPKQSYIQGGKKGYFDYAAPLIGQAMGMGMNAATGGMSGAGGQLFGLLNAMFGGK